MTKLRAVVAVLCVGAILLTSPLEVLAKGGGRSKGSKGNVSTGEQSVRSYTRKDGTYVPGHHRTNPDSSKANNWSTKGNVNPYTGKPGTKQP